jgi:hypothetical protein
VGEAWHFMFVSVVIGLEEEHPGTLQGFLLGARTSDGNF